MGGERVINERVKGRFQKAAGKRDCVRYARKEAGTKRLLADGLFEADQAQFLTAVLGIC